MQVVILAGGLATRLQPLTNQIPKSLLPIAGRPFIDYQLELLARHSLTDIVLCTGYLGEQVAAHCGDGGRYGLRVRYSPDGPTLRGTGGALRQARPFLDEQFFVLYGDSYLPCDYQAIAQYFIASGLPGLMTVYNNHNQYDRSNVVMKDGRVMVYDKKHQTPAMHWVDYGLSAFRREVIENVPAPDPFDVAELHQALIREKKLAAYEIAERFYEIGSPTGLAEFAQKVPV